MIKLIASDLDGTLIGADFRFRPRTLQALHAAADAGIQVVFVTGRPLRWMSPVLEQLGEEWNGENSFVFCSNGAVTFDIARGEVVRLRTVPGSLVHRVHADLLQAYPQATFIAETLDPVYVQGPYTPHAQEDLAAIVQGQLGDIVPVGAQVVKYLLFHEGQSPAELLRTVHELADGRVSVTRSAPYQPLVEMGQAGVHKGGVLADFAAAHGISAQQVLAFGDMPNDLEMLQWAGHGYAMASGLPEVQQRVGRVCPGFDEDGVAQVIERMLRRQG